MRAWWFLVPHVPVGDIAAPGVGELADGVGVALRLLHGHLAVLHRQQPILLGLVVVELGKQQLRLALQGRVLPECPQLLLDLPLLGLVEEPPGVDAVFDALHLLLGGHGEELVDADAEVHGDLRQQLHVGHGGAALPFADGLGGHVQRRRQGLLGEAPILPQAADLLSHFHRFVLLAFVALSIPPPPALCQRPNGELTRAKSELYQIAHGQRHARSDVLRRCRVITDSFAPPTPWPG